MDLLATLHSLSIKFSSCEIQLDIYCTCNCDTLQAASRRKVSHFSYPHVGGVLFWGCFFSLLHSTIICLGIPSRSIFMKIGYHYLQFVGRSKAITWEVEMF